MKKNRIAWYVYQIKYFLQNRFKGVKTPLLAGMKITHRCNLACRHCPFWKKDSRQLTFSEIKENYKKLHDNGIRILIIEGGEPFLWKDHQYTIHDVIREAKKFFFFVGITTNGTFPLDTDTDIIWVSIDGLEATHNTIRGHCFDRVISHIKESSHSRIFANITINTLNAREVPELVEFLTPIVRGITIQFHYPYSSVSPADVVHYKSGPGSFPYKESSPGDSHDDVIRDTELYLPLEERQVVLDQLIGLKKRGFAVSDSYACLRALKQNTWTCRPWMIASVDPDNTYTHGCYVKNRGPIACEKCGFAAHAEISLAYNGAIGSILTGNRIFRVRRN